MRNPPVKLLDRVRQSIRLKGYSIRTEKTYAFWIKRFILFHGKRHPNEMGKSEIETFLTHLAVNRNVGVKSGTTVMRRLLTSYALGFNHRYKRPCQSHLALPEKCF